MQIIKGEQYFPVRDFETIPQMIRQCVSLFGDKPAVVHRLLPDMPAETITYRQLWNDALILYSNLKKIGATGSRIAIVGENSYHWILAYLASVFGAGIVVPIDRLLPESEILELLSRGEVETVFYDSAFIDVFTNAETFQTNQADEKIKCLPHNRICMRSGRLKPDQNDKLAKMLIGIDDLTSNEDNKKPVFMDMSDLLDSSENISAIELPTIDPDKIMALLFTSGTTSMAKGVMLSQRNVCSDIKGIAGVVKLNPGLRMLSILPLHHTFENTCGLLMALYVGACIHICDGLRYIQKNMQEYKIEMIIGVPAVFESFYQKINDKLIKSGKAALVKRLIKPVKLLRKIKIDVSRKIFKQIHEAFGGCFYMGICGAAPIDPAVISFFDDIGVRILQGYGLTETSPVVSGCNSKIFVPGTVGRPVDNVTVAIDCNVPGSPGEILVKGPIVMLGYYKDEATTSEVIDEDGWFHTGDIGIIDPKTNCITITGRKKSMIVLRNGKKVFPEEVEYLINQFDFIKESLVFGDETEEGDIVVSAKLVIDEKALADKHGLSAEDQEVQSFLERMLKEVNANMPSFKSIRQHVFSFKDMIKTTTLKVKRQIEIDNLKDLMDRQKLKWREMKGSNIDKYGKTDGKNDNKSDDEEGRKSDL